MLAMDRANPRYITQLPHERQHEILKSLQLTRDFLRALPSVPHLLSHTTGYFVRLNKGSRYFHYMAVQIYRIVGDELHVKGADKHAPDDVQVTKLAYVSNAQLKPEELTELVGKIAVGAVDNLQVARAQEMAADRERVIHDEGFNTVRLQMQQAGKKAQLERQQRVQQQAAALQAATPEERALIRKAELEQALADACTLKQLERAITAVVSSDVVIDQAKLQRARQRVTEVRVQRDEFIDLLDPTRKPNTAADLIKYITLATPIKKQLDDEGWFDRHDLDTFGESLRSASERLFETLASELETALNSDASALKAALGSAKSIVAELKECQGEGAMSTSAEFDAAMSKARSRLAELERSEAWRAERVAAGVDGLMGERPAEHSCPIGYDVMVDPVTASDGFTYERAEIERWLAENDRSPTTGADLPHKFLNPALALKSLIRDWEEEEHKRCMEKASRKRERENEGQDSCPQSGSDWGVCDPE